MKSLAKKLSFAPLRHGSIFLSMTLLAQGLSKRGDLSARTIEKFLSKNPQRFYHL